MTPKKKGYLGIRALYPRPNYKEKGHPKIDPNLCLCHYLQSFLTSLMLKSKKANRTPK